MPTVKSPTRVWASPRKSRHTVPLMLLSVAALCVGCSSGSTDTPVPTSTGASEPSALVVTQGPPPPLGATGEPTVGISTLPPVPPETASDFGNGLTATVTKIEQIQVQANGPGEIAGPGVSVAVEMRNGSDAAVDLNGVVVNASFSDGRPADSNESPPAKRLSGSLAPGDTAAGTYVFQVPESAAGSVVVQIDWNGSPNVILVRR